MAADSQPPSGQKLAAPVARGGAAAALVGAGMLLSRAAGLVRQMVLAVYFGSGLQADVWSAGLRLPNVLQNLLGEGTLSASFIPAYSSLLGQGRTQEAGRVAGAMFALLLAIAGAVALLGVLFAPVLVAVFTPGFVGARRELAIAVVRIVFPMTGVLVLSAWALGILNSHRQFFLPYFAPVVWNAAIIATLIAFGSRLDLDGLLLAAAWGALAGGVLQFAVQLPAVRKLDRQIRLNTGRNEPAFHDAVRKAVPAIMGRGVVQLSSYVDLLLGSLLAIGAVARLGYAQTLYLLPVSLFGMSVAAAELPDLARDRDASAVAVRGRTVGAVRRVAFFIVPSVAAFVLLGNVLVAGVYQGLYRGGRFGDADVMVVWLTLAAYSAGLLASTCTRVYQSTFFALRDTVTPARVAGLRVLVAFVAGASLMLQFEPVAAFGWQLPAGVLAGLRVAGQPLGTLGLATGATLGAWLEWWLLRRALEKRLGPVDAGLGYLGRAAAAALGGAVVGKCLALVPLPPLPTAVLAAAGFGVTYVFVARAFGLAEAAGVLAALQRRLRR